MKIDMVVHIVRCFSLKLTPKSFTAFHKTQPKQTPLSQIAKLSALNGCLQNSQNQGFIKMFYEKRIRLRFFM